MWIFAAFLVVPMIEIGLFIQIGDLIGLWPTLGLVVATAVIGTALVRSQGARALADLRIALADMRDPTAPMAHGAMILFSGALLLTPGFFTDAVGIALLLPPVRRAIMRFIAKRMTIASFTVGPESGSKHPRQPHRPGVIDGDYFEIDPQNPPTDPRSGWTRH
jgi:UPF0716 protein FxsA